MATIKGVASQLKKRRQQIQEMTAEDYGKMPIDTKSAVEQSEEQKKKAERERLKKIKERELREAAEYKKQRAKELAEKQNVSEEVEVIRVPRRK